MQFTQIKETCLYVSSLDATNAFYNEKLGLKVIGRVENRHIFFRAGSSVLLCFISETTRNDTKLPPHHGTGRLHLAFEVKAGEYERWKDRIEELGIPVEQEQHWPGSFRSFYFRDPDGHLLEIVQEGMWGL
jgi:catechol 2,3-dioxygenase-like lactoylglutathione lyase family enzyme